MALQPKTQTTAPGPNRTSPRWLSVAFWVSILISIAVVLRRLVALARPAGNGPPELVGLDKTFASHWVITVAHIVPALLLVLIAPVIVLRRSAPIIPLERAFYLLGALVGLTAYAMNVFAIGGWTERSAVLAFDSLYLFSLARAYLYRLRGATPLEHRWQLRALAILLGIATTRPVMGVFFATSRLTHLVAAQFFGIAFWIGFSLNLLAFELWIRSRDRHAGKTSTGVGDLQTRSLP